MTNEKHDAFVDAASTSLHPVLKLDLEGVPGGP